MLKMELLDNFDSGNPAGILQAALVEFEARHRVEVTIHDLRALLYDRNGVPLLPGRDHHRHSYCAAGRYRNGEWNRHCMEECAFQAESLAQHELHPFLHRCWKGVTELVVPVTRERQAVLMFYVGAFRTSGAEPPAELASEWEQLPEAEPERFAAAAAELTLLGQGMLALAGRRHGPVPVNRRSAIRKFIEDHAHCSASLEGLARELNVSSSRASHLVSTLFGRSFQELLLEERLTRARNLLLATNYPLKEIARSTGFANQFYFSRMFRRYCGLAPGAYRKRHCTSGAVNGGEYAGN